jgi:uncharacterized protein (DUF1778 family)
MMMERKYVTITLRMKPEEHDLLKRAAEADRRSINAFAMRTLVRQARAVLRQAEQQRQAEHEVAREERGDGDDR